MGYGQHHKRVPNNCKDIQKQPVREKSLAGPQTMTDATERQHGTLGLCTNLYTTGLRCDGSSWQQAANVLAVTVIGVSIIGHSSNCLDKEADFE